MPIMDYACLDCFNVDLNVNPSPDTEGPIEVVSVRGSEQRLVNIKTGQKYRCTDCGSTNTTIFNVVSHCARCFSKNKGEKVEMKTMSDKHPLLHKCPKCGYITRAIPVE